LSEFKRIDFWDSF